MKMTVEIDMDNAAFEDCPASEAARILREVAEEVEAGATDLRLRDTNGNKVGKMAIEG